MCVFQELEEQRRASREAAKEKLVAVARAKDQVREQSNTELEDVRQKVKQVRPLIDSFIDCFQSSKS